MFVVQHRKIFYIISSVLVVLSLLSLIFFGLNFGIDFKGGSLIEVQYHDVTDSVDSLRNDLKPLNVDASVRPTGSHGYIIRTKNLTPEEHDAVIRAILPANLAKMEEKRFDSVGPILGKELQGKAIISIVLVILAIVLFITFAFRKVSGTVSSWKYGYVAIIALVHDVIVPVGFFSFFGHLYGFEVDTLFITAILVVLGFSVHDTIVVFDRVRENLKHASSSKPFEEVVGESVSQTFTRSINTSVTVLLSLIILYIFGAEATKNFSLVLFVGIIAGTYSSIFLGSPLLVTLEKWKAKKRKKS